jgi:hypothetical protein
MTNPILDQGDEGSSFLESLEDEKALLHLISDDEEIWPLPLEDADRIRHPSS